MATEREEKGLLLSSAGQREHDEKRLKIISSQKNNKKECKDWERKEDMGIYCTGLGELMVRTRLGIYLRSYCFKKGSTLQYKGSHVGETAKQFQKQDTVQEVNPPYPSPVTVHMKQVCRTGLQYTNPHSGIVQKKEQKPREGMHHLDVISPSFIPAAFPRPSLPCSIFFWILHHVFLFSWARMSSRR